MVYSKQDKNVLNLFAKKKNSSIAIEQFKNDDNFSLDAIIFKSDGNIANEIDPQLVNFYITNVKRRDFYVVAKIIANLGDEFFKGDFDWEPFLNSFKEDDGSGYIDNENNRNILETLNTKGIFSKFRYIKKNKHYVVKYENSPYREKS